MEDKKFLQFLATLPDNLKQNYRFDMHRYWELAGKPRDFNEGLTNGLFTLEGDGLYHARTVLYNPETGDYEFMKAHNHPTLHLETDWYDGTGPYLDENGNYSAEEEERARQFRKKYIYVPKMDDSEFGMYTDRMKWDPKLKAFRGPVLDEVVVKPKE